MNGAGVTEGWYADPANRYHQRWWDGRVWTSRVRAAGGEFRDRHPVDQPAPGQWVLCGGCGGRSMFEDEDHCWRCCAPFPECGRYFAWAPHLPPQVSEEALAAFTDEVGRCLGPAQAALDQGRPGDAFRGFEVALAYLSIAQAMAPQIRYSGGAGVGMLASVLTGGWGLEDLIIGPVVAAMFRSGRRRAVAWELDHLAAEVTFRSLIALSSCPRMLARPGTDREVLVRMAGVIGLEGAAAVPTSDILRQIATMLLSLHAQAPELTPLLADLAAHYGWREWYAPLAACGFLVEPGHAGGTSQGETASPDPTSSGGPRLDALLLLGFASTDKPDPDEVLTAFRREAHKYHPDRHHLASADLQELAAERMRRITDARDLLLGRTSSSVR